MLDTFFLSKKYTSKVLSLDSCTTTDSVGVKYRGPADLAPFGCTDITRSSFVRRVCYDLYRALDRETNQP